MHIQKVTKEKATIRFSREELGFMIAATSRALNEINPAHFYTRTGRTRDYADAVLVQLRVASGGSASQIPTQPDEHASEDAYTSHALTSQHVVLTIDSVDHDGALISISDHELRFLNNAINEAVNGLSENKEFEETGKTGEYSDRLMDQLIEASRKIETLN